MEQAGDDVSGRESFRLWSIALVLSVLLYFGVASVLADQLSATRDAALTDAIVVAMELIQPTPEPARQEWRPIPRPPRTALKETSPLPPVESKPMPLSAPPEP